MLTKLSPSDQIGNAISRATNLLYFPSVDPPENTTISNNTIDVEEGMSPPRVACSGDGHPPLKYKWFRETAFLQEGSGLQINKNMTRKDDGVYECLSWNPHGNQTATMRINVLCK